MNPGTRRHSGAHCAAPHLAAAVLLLLHCAPLLSADELRGEAYERLKKAFVEILVEDHLDGSGWIADSEGLVVTAAHVVNTPGKRVEIMSPAVGRVEAKVIAIDRGNDTAVLKIPAREGGYPALGFADKVPAPAVRVFLLGSPVFRHGVLQTATIARDSSTFEFMGFSGDYVRIMHLSGYGPPGSSGGPWVNARGEVIGLNSGMMRDGNASAGIGFMVPLDPIRSLVRAKQTPGTPTLGSAFEEIWEQKPEYLRRYPPKTEGLTVRALKKEGPAMRAGLADGDLVVALNDKPVRLRDEAMEILRGLKSGDTVKVKLLLPGGGESEKTVPLGNLEADWTVRNP